MQKNNTRDPKVIALIILLVTFIGIVIWNNVRDRSTAPAPQSPATQQTEKKQEKPVDTSDLDLTIDRQDMALKITNNESADLKNCEVRINPGTVNNGYTYRADLPSKQTISILYTSFKKAADKYNTSKEPVTKVVVTRCTGQESRLSTYGT